MVSLKQISSLRRDLKICTYEHSTWLAETIYGITPEVNRAHGHNHENTIFHPGQCPLDIITLRFVFFFVVSAYSFKCYTCIDESSDNCNKNQTSVTCTGNDKTCIKADGELESGKTLEMRGCLDTKDCDESKKKCEDGTATFGDAGDKFKECRVVCCVPSDDETPCNSAFTVTSNMVIMMLAILLSLDAF